MKTKIVLLLTVLLLSATTGFAESGTCGEYLTWTLSNGTLTISGTGEMADYDWDGGPWYSYNSSITTVIIEDGVTSIGDEAFYNCRSLVAVNIGNGVTSIGHGAFADCSSLTSLIIPDGVTTIGGKAFNSCSSLTSITIPESVTSIGEYALGFCDRLTDVTVFWDSPADVSLPPTDEGNIFEGVDTRNVRLHVPSGTEAAYLDADVWKDFDIGEAQLPLLANLTADKGNLRPEFNPSRFYYQMTVFKGIENITLQATPVEGATVSGDGTKALNIGENTVEITVTLQGDVSVYTVVVTRLSVDYELQALSSAEVETGVTKVSFYELGLGPYPVIDEIQLKYRLTTGNVSGSLPLHFNAGHSKTLDKTVEVNANSIYEFTLLIGLEYYDDYGRSLSVTIHFDDFGRPSYATLSYTRYENTVTASSGSEELSAYRFNMPGDNIKTVAISDLTFIGNITPTAIAEADAQPAIAVYPNPVKESFRIDGLTDPTSVIITDLSGRTVLQQTVSSNETIPAGHWPEGVYLLRVNNQSIKFIKN